MHIAHDVYREFLKAVVISKVFSAEELTRGSGPLGEEQQRELQRGQREDTRTPPLVRMSGKGGWSPDAERRKDYAVFTNVTLLDHLTSVVRGALQFAEIDLSAKRARPEEELRRRMSVVAANAFLHDADKMLGLSRKEVLDTGMVAGLMRRFGIDHYLHTYGAALTPAQMLILIDGAEVTRAGGLEVIPREYLHDRRYVRLADRLDGIFLKTRPTKLKELVGVEGVLDEIKRFADLDTDAARGGAEGLRLVELRDPHTPSLLDALQAALSATCREQHGVPPLIETHHDGRLLVVLPQHDSDAIIARAFGRTTRQLGARIKVATNDRGTINLLEARGTLEELRDVVVEMPAREREFVLRAGIDALREHGQEIDAFLHPVGFLPRIPDLSTYQGRLVPVWIGTATMEDGSIAIHRNAVLVNAVLSCDDPSARLGIPNAARREAELRQHLVDHGKLTQAPAWLDPLPAATRRTLLSAYAAAAAASDQTWNEALLGSDGLVALWLEGRDDRPGLVTKIAETSTRLRRAVEDHYRTLLAGRYSSADEDEEGRCHFTNAPVPRSARIDGETELYGVNVSAFSGREGRPESFRPSKGETLVSPVAEAEHRLRKIDYQKDGRSAKRRDTPVRVTSPTTAGLFGALAYANDADVAEYALSDVLRSHIQADKLTYNNADAALRRTRIARFEELPTRLASSRTEPGQISFVAMAFSAAQRTGRPIHIFRGLPRPRPEFVAFDALPQTIEDLLGGTGFRVEEVPRCLTLLRGIEAVAGTTGFGEELALRLCSSGTRFGAACDALARAETRLAAKGADQRLFDIKAFAINLLEDADTMPSDTDRALVAFGEAMAFVQRIPIRSDGGNVAELGLRITLDTVEALERMGQTADDSLVAGIAGEITEVLARRNLLARAELRGGRKLADMIEAAARVFVDQVWPGAFAGVIPSSRNRRVALATYRFAFHSQASRLRANAGLDATEPAPSVVGDVLAEEV